MAGKEILQPGGVRCLERLRTRLDTSLRKSKSGLLPVVGLDANIMAEGRSRAGKPEPGDLEARSKTKFVPELSLASSFSSLLA